MANAIELTLPGGLYKQAITLDWVLGKEVDRFSYTINGAQPTMSRYIAYDTLRPPKPFLAVTQDGLGNVVYDGGFPKFYTAKYSSSWNTFAKLSASFKYFYNALKFIANAEKLAVGNNKILFLTDKINGDDYGWQTGGRGYNFRTPFTNVSRLAGFEPTFKTRANYTGAILNPTFAELDEYCAVVVMSSTYTNVQLIADTAVTEMVTYREAGNGLFFITDHGGYVNATLEQSQTGNRSEGFYKLANKVIANFGSFFTGNYDRASVNVGFLRRNYGDHALYNGMADSEAIYAGKSESQITVAQYPEYTKETAPQLTFDADGAYTIRILAILKDGTPKIFRYRYNVVIGEFLWWRDLDGNNLEGTYQTGKSTSDFLPYVESNGEGTLTGNILRNGKKIASFVRSDITGTSFRWFAGTDVFPVNDNDVFMIEVVTPFNYRKPLLIDRYQPALNSIDYARTLVALDVEPYQGIPRKQLINAIVKDIAPSYPDVNLTEVGDSARGLMYIRRYTSSFIGDPTTAYIYPTTADTNAAKATLTTEPMCIIDAQLNQVWEYVYPTWKLVEGLTAQDFLGAPRLVTGITNNIVFRLLVNGGINRL